MRVTLLPLLNFSARLGYCFSGNSTFAKLPPNQPLSAILRFSGPHHTLPERRLVVYLILLPSKLHLLAASFAFTPPKSIDRPKMPQTFRASPLHHFPTFYFYLILVLSLLVVPVSSNSSYSPPRGGASKAAGVRQSKNIKIAYQGEPGAYSEKR